MKTYEIEKQIENQRSILNAFPSQAPSIEQGFGGENQRAAVEMQIENAKLLLVQDSKLNIMNENLKLMVENAKYNEVIETTRYAQALFFSKIAAWSGVVAVVLTVLGLVLK